PSAGGRPEGQPGNPGHDLQSPAPRRGDGGGRTGIMDGLHDLPRPEGSHRDRKRLGRGPGSGTGKTSGFGHKGSKARAGHHGPGGGKPAYEGGQMPLHRRLPKRGFTNLNRVEYQIVNLDAIEKLDEAEITPEVLHERGLIGHATRPVKVLGNGS